MVFWKKQRVIETLVLRHAQCVDEALSYFQEALSAYLEGETKKASELALETHQAEGRADDVRREVEAELLGGALLARSRGEVLEVIEGVDKLANAGEAALDYLLLQRVRIPEEIKPMLREIMVKNQEIFEEVKQALQLLFQDMSQALEHTKAIEIKEGEVDHLERSVIKQLFKMDIDLAEKIQMRGLVEELVELSDRAEDLSDRIDIMIAERNL
jgi:hypothetical protein